MKFKIGDKVTYDKERSYYDNETLPESDFFEVLGLQQFSNIEKIYLQEKDGEFGWYLSDYFDIYEPELKLSAEEKKYLIEIMSNVVNQLDKVDSLVDRSLRNAINEGREFIVNLGAKLDYNSDPIEDY